MQSNVEINPNENKCKMSAIQKIKKSVFVKTSNTRICSFLIADVFMILLKCAVVCRKNTHCNRALAQLQMHTTLHLFVRMH